jgi:hypothetical protein
MNIPYIHPLAERASPLSNSSHSLTSQFKQHYVVEYHETKSGEPYHEDDLF